MAGGRSHERSSRGAARASGGLAIAVAALTATASLAGAQPLPDRVPRAPLTEVARAQVGAEVAWQRYGLSGRGSTLCLVDTGADSAHPTLRDAGGEPRVRWVLDAFGAPRGAHPALEAAHGGAVYGPDEVERAPGDPHGHGTAMASIALGDDAGEAAAEPGPAAGLAPRAQLVVARAWDPDRRGFPDEAVVRGVDFCRAVARRDPALDPRRLVVLLSLGGHDGAHDGEGAFEQALAAHAADAPVVVAAGNDGERPVRAAGRILRGETAPVEVRVPRAARPDAEVALTVRTDGPFAVEGPDGARAGPLAVDRAHGAALGGARLEIEPSPDRPGLARVVLRAADGPLPPGTYRLALDGPARFEVWLAGARLGPTFFAPGLGGPFARADEQITIPATAPALVAVGAAVARPAVDGVAPPLEGEPGAPARFSARGPTASGAPKPDLIAPGGWVLAALSGDVRPGDPDNLTGGRLDGRTAPDGRLAVRGSSAAAAVVAGALLLALELDPTLGPTARERLVASAVGDGWAPDRGWGRLDVGRLLAAVSEASPRPQARPRLVATRPFVPTDPALWVAARGAFGRSLSLTVDGRRARAAPIAGVVQIPLVPRVATVGSTVAIEASLDGAPLPPLEVPVVLDRSPRGAVEPAGGGCAAGPRAPRERRGGPPLAALAFAVALGASRRARGSGGGPRSVSRRRARAVPPRPRPRAARRRRPPRPRR